MEDKKKIKILIILVAILSILIISVLGYLITDKFFNNDDNTNNIKENVNNEETIDESTKSEDKELSIDEFMSLLKGYWAKTDSSDNITIIFEDNIFTLGYFASEASIKAPIQELEKVSDNEYRFLADNNYIYVDLTEVNNNVIYVRINGYSISKYTFVSTDYNEAFNYFFN